MKDKDDKNSAMKNDQKENNSGKKLKILYELDKKEKSFIQADIVNKKYWDDCMEMTKNGKKVYIFAFGTCNFVFVLFCNILIGLFG